MRDADVLLDLGHIQVGLVRARGEDRHDQRRHEGPRTGAGREQAAKGRAGRAKGACQRDARKEGRARGADVRVFRAQHGFGLQDIRAALQQIRRQPRRNVGEDRCGAQLGGRRQVERQRLADQQYERVLGLRAQPDLGGVIGLSLFHGGLRQAQVQFRRGACVVLQLYDGVGRLRRLQGVLRHRELLIKRKRGEVLVGDLRHQQDLRGLARMRTRQVLLERSIGQALKAAEEVNLPRGR